MVLLQDLKDNLPGKLWDGLTEMRQKDRQKATTLTVGIAGLLKIKDHYPENN